MRYKGRIPIYGTEWNFVRFQSTLRTREVPYFEYSRVMDGTGVPYFVLVPGSPGRLQWWVCQIACDLAPAVAAEITTSGVSNVSHNNWPRFTTDAPSWQVSRLALLKILTFDARFNAWDQKMNSLPQALASWVQTTSWRHVKLSTFVKQTCDFTT